MTSGISDSLKPYLPPSLLQADGTLKAGVTQAQATEVAQGIQARAGALPPSEAKLFLAMVAAADLAPNGQVPADIDGALDRLGSAANVIASMAISSNAMNYLGRVMIEQAGEQRKSALEDRLNAREMAKGELLAQAGKLREEADKLSSSSLSAMIMTVVMASVGFAMGAASAVLSGVSAVKGATGAMKESGAKFMSSANATADKAGKAMPFHAGDIFMKSTDGIQADKIGKLTGAFAGVAGSASQSANQLGQGVSGYISTDGQAQAKNLEADGSIHAANAQEEQAIGDLRKEQRQALDEMVQAIIQFLKDMQESKAQQMQSLTRV